MRIDTPIMNRLNDYHEKTEIPKARIINMALQFYLDQLEADCEDKADYETAVAAWNDYEKNGKKGITAEELFKKAGI